MCPRAAQRNHVVQATDAVRALDGIRANEEETGAAQAESDRQELQALVGAGGLESEEHTSLPEMQGDSHQ